MSESSSVEVDEAMLRWLDAAPEGALPLAAAAALVRFAARDEMGVEAAQLPAADQLAKALAETAVALPLADGMVVGNGLFAPFSSPEPPSPVVLRLAVARDVPEHMRLVGPWRTPERAGRSGSGAAVMREEQSEEAGSSSEDPSGNAPPASSPRPSPPALAPAPSPLRRFFRRRRERKRAARAAAAAAVPATPVQPSRPTDGATMSPPPSRDNVQPLQEHAAPRQGGEGLGAGGAGDAPADVGVFEPLAVLAEADPVVSAHVHRLAPQLLDRGVAFAYRLLPTSKVPALTTAEALAAKSVWAMAHKPGKQAHDVWKGGMGRLPTWRGAKSSSVQRWARALELKTRGLFRQAGLDVSRFGMLPIQMYTAKLEGDAKAWWERLVQRTMVGLDEPSDLLSAMEVRWPLPPPHKAAKRFITDRMRMVVPRADDDPSVWVHDLAAAVLEALVDLPTHLEAAEALELRILPSLPKLWQDGDGQAGLFSFCADLGPVQCCPEPLDRIARVLERCQRRAKELVARRELRAGAQAVRVPAEAKAKEKKGGKGKA